MTLGSHQKTVGGTQTWITPKWILDALGTFNLDPCAADPRPWDCAQLNWSMNGLVGDWVGRVWLNPPFDRYQVGDWIRKLANHGWGTALLHVRTEAAWFEPVWEKAKGILFLSDRLYFHYPDGRRADANSGAPVCLVAFGEADAKKLLISEIKGYFVTDWHQKV